MSDNQSRQDSDARSRGIRTNHRTWSEAGASTASSSLNEARCRAARSKLQAAQGQRAAAAKAELAELTRQQAELTQRQAELAQQQAELTRRKAEQKQRRLRMELVQQEMNIVKQRLELVRREGDLRLRQVDAEEALEALRLQHEVERCQLELELSDQEGRGALPAGDAASSVTVRGPVVTAAEPEAPVQLRVPPQPDSSVPSTREWLVQPQPHVLPANAEFDNVSSAVPRRNETDSTVKTLLGWTVTGRATKAAVTVTTQGQPPVTTARHKRQAANATCASVPAEPRRPSPAGKKRARRQGSQSDDDVMTAAGQQQGARAQLGQLTPARPPGNEPTWPPTQQRHMDGLREETAPPTALTAPELSRRGWLWRRCRSPPRPRWYRTTWRRSTPATTRSPGHGQGQGQGQGRRQGQGPASGTTTDSTPPTSSYSQAPSGRAPIRPRHLIGGTWGRLATGELETGPGPGLVCTARDWTRSWAGRCRRPCTAGH